MFLGWGIFRLNPHLSEECSKHLSNTVGAGLVYSRALYAQVGLATGVPTLFGIVTTDTIEQAIERAGTKAGNKGYDAACSAIEMINLIKNIEK